MKFKALAIAAFAALLFGFFGARMVTADVDPELREAMLQGLKNVRPDFKFNSVEETSAKGIYRVTIDRGPTIYMTGNGKHFFVGEFFSVTKDDLVDEGEAYLEKERASSLAGLDRSDMIIFGPDKPRAHVYVFTDVDCYYCQKLHREMEQINDYGVEVRYLGFPRAGVNSPVHKKLASAWCAKDPNDALTRLKAGEDIPEILCDGNPVASQYHLGNRLGVSGTPAIFSSTGAQLGGYVPADVIAQRLGLSK